METRHRQSEKESFIPIGPALIQGYSPNLYNLEEKSVTLSEACIGLPQNLVSVTPT
jgi:hypothetical protein